MSTGRLCGLPHCCEFDKPFKYKMLNVLVADVYVYAGVVFAHTPSTTESWYQQTV